jgi:hypothetical protein
MVIMGMIIGALFFSRFNSTLAYYKYGFPVWKMLLVMVIGLHSFPVLALWIFVAGQKCILLTDQVGLCLKYIANILYALLLENFQKTA